MAGIYIHIPFCKQACNYCNFHFSTSFSQKYDLVVALIKEMGIRKSYLQNEKIDTVYFGGGTPSLLSIEELKRIFGAIEDYFPNQHLKEITLEVNPDDLNKPYLNSLKTTPINRLSIGVQSFRDEDLCFMHRAHTSSEADYAIKAAQDGGFENMSIDLIYGTPGMDDKAWKNNIYTAFELSIPHISSYALTVEPRTTLSHQIAKGKCPPVDANQAANQFLILMNEMEQQGYDHYEISNFALPNKYALHNTNYWCGVHYLGIGPSAHSFNGVSRQWNVANNSVYIKSINSKGMPDFEEEQLTTTNRINEYLMTSLRTMWGADLQKISLEFGEDYKNEIYKNILPYIENGKVKMIDNFLQLTKEGKLFADAIASDLFFLD